MNLNVQDGRCQRENVDRVVNGREAKIRTRDVAGKFVLVYRVIAAFRELEAPVNLDQVGLGTCRRPVRAYLRTSWDALRDEGSGDDRL